MACFTVTAAEAVVVTVAAYAVKKHEEKKEAKDEKKNKWLIKERNFSQFSRSFTLPDDVDGDNLSANVKNGILTVTMPRKAAAVPRKIAITCA